MNNPEKDTFKIRFGIIGTNFIADWLLEASRLDPRFEAVGVYSRTQGKADAFAHKHNIRHTFTSLEDMAKSNLIDAVYIASPNSYHAQQSILFMKHGKHILCEKPLASNAKEVTQMIRVAKENQVLLMEAMKSTLNPNFLQMKKHIQEIGTVRRYFSSYCQYSSRYDKLKEGIVLNAFDPTLSNGATMDLGVYTIYPMVVLFGRPQKISATGLTLSTGVDGQGGINFEYKDMNATVLYSKIADSFLPTEIQGEKGTIVADKIQAINKITLHKKGNQELDLSENNIQNEYFYEIAEFLDLLEAKKLESDINSHQNSLITIEIVDEIRKQLGIIFPADKEVE